MLLDEREQWLPCPTNSSFHFASGETRFPIWYGFIAAPIAMACYGSNLVPLKKIDTGDGVFFQWTFCSAIMLIGIIINLIRNCPKFYPVVMMGGVSWALGNALVVITLKLIGLSLSMLLWGAANLLAGWLTGRFGVFGLCKEIPKSTLLNYLGVAFALTRIVITFFVRVHKAANTLRENSVTNRIKDSTNADLTHSHCNTLSPSTCNTLNHSETCCTMTKEHLIGCLLAISSGLMYGVSFDPSIYVQNHYVGASQNGLDYVFSQFTGIYLTSFMLLLIYCIVMKRPKVYNNAILPGFLSGSMWAMATACWFVANSTLSAAVSFPLITSGTAFIALLWGVIVFKEIQGRWNFFLVTMAFVCTMFGGTLAGLSKVIIFP